jgi:ABC-type branched-subunit amino acid transport system ATPase component/ABC-type branched-subunit amino acid transport system permease subunit
MTETADTWAELRERLTAQYYRAPAPVRSAMTAVGAAAALWLAMQAAFGRQSTGSVVGLPWWDAIPLGVFLNGAVIGTLYALIAFGVILVHRASRVLNFAQAALGAVPGVLALLLVYRGVPYLVGVGVAIAGSIVMGFVVEAVILRPFRHQARLVFTVATIGVAQGLVLLESYLPKWVAGRDVAPTSFPTPFQKTRVEIGGVILSGDYLAIVVVAGLLMVGLAAFFRFTDTGIAVRASAENSDRALLLGIPVARVGTLVWILAALCSGLAVFLRGPVVGVAIGTNLSPVLLLYGLAAAIVARMESLPVALGAGMAIGVLEQGSFFSTSRPDLSAGLILPVLLVALLRRRRALARAADTGVSSFRALREYRPIPMELRGLRQVRLARIGSRLLVAALALSGPYLVGTDRAGAATLVIIYAIVGVSLVVLSGWAGQISLGQFAFAGVGAGIAGGLATRHGTDFFLTLGAAVVAGAVIALLIGIPALRVPGLFLAAVTLALAASVQNIFLNPQYMGSLVPNGDDIIRRPILWSRLDVSSDVRFYYVCLAALVLCYLSARSLRSSRSGRVFIGVRDNVKSAQSYGVRPAASKLASFAVSGAMSALAGALMAYQQGAVDRTTFPLSLSLDAFVFTVLGGLSSLPGAVSGAVVYECLRFFNPFEGFFTAAIASGVLTLLTVAPGGFAEVGFRTRDRWLRRVANKAGILVPSLVADRREEQELEEDVLPGAPVGERPEFVPSDDPLLVCRGIDVAYDGVQVLFGVDLEVRRGEVLALLGTNGAGKSTLLKAISGLIAPSAGTVTLDGVDVTGIGPNAMARNRVVQVPGGRGIFPTLTVAEHLRAAAWLHRTDKARIERITADITARFPRLGERWDQMAGNLSGGEQQQLAIGMALLADPVLLIIDELSLGLAPKIVEELLDLVRDINATGVSVVLVEQSVNLALTVADRAYFMEKGEVRFEGPTAELLQRGDIVRSVFLEGAVGGGPATTGPRQPSVASDDSVAADRPVVLETQGLHVRFGGINAVRDVSLSVQAGEVLGLIGPNGAGKTTIFDAICGFVSLADGRVLLGGEDVTAWTPDRRARAGLGRSFQDARVFPSLTVAENLALSLERHLPVRDHLAAALGLPEVREAEDDIAWSVADLIDLMSLGAFRDKFVSELSTGSRRVVDLAMSVAHDPAVLVLDEPSSGIAQREAEALAPLLERIRTETHCAMLIIEHDMPLITTVSDRLLALELGLVIAEGTPAEVVRDPRVIASYLGEDEAAVQRSGAIGSLVEAGA